MDGWVNLDVAPLPGVNLVADLERCREIPLGLPDNCVGEFLLSHVLEHIRDAMGLMMELYRVAMPGARMTLRLPYGTSDDAWEDPTHVRPYFLNSLFYYSQPAYWRADYGYRADWKSNRTLLKVPAARFQGKTAQEIMQDVHTLRNVVTEMVVELEAVKPMREPRQDLITYPVVDLMLV